MTTIVEVPGLQSFSRVSLGHAPTPIEHAPRLGEALGVDLYVKRDDCTGLALGGNKVRQLEFYLGAAQAERADVVLITGAVQSNFVRLTAAAARHLGMDVHVQLEERVANSDEAYRNSGNVLLDRLLGATIHTFPAGEDEAAADDALEAIAAQLAVSGRNPYVIHLGVDHPPIGALGYVRAAAEASAQLREMGVALDAAVVPSGSGLTHSGFLVGLRAVGESVPVEGVCVRRDAGLQLPRVQRRSEEVAALIEQPDVMGEGDVRLSDASLAPGYGKLNDDTFRAIELAGRLEGLLLDPVYSGKTLAGLMAMVADGTIARGARVLFVHTGGQAAIFGYQQALQERLDGVIDEAETENF